MRTKLLLTLALLLSFATQAQTTYTFTGVGDWDQLSNWDTYPGDIINSGDTVIINGDVLIFYLENNGTIINEGNINNIDLLNNGTIINEGSINNDFDLINNGTINNTSTGSIINNGDLIHSGVFNNSGTFINDSSGHIEQEAVINNIGTLENDGTIGESFGAVDPNAIIYNTGTLIGKTSLHRGYLNNAGTFKPADEVNIWESHGEYTLKGSYTQQSNATLEIEIYDNSNYSSLSITGNPTIPFPSQGTATLSGTLHLNTGPNHDNLNIGDTFTILTASSISGTFDTITHNDGYLWNVIYTATSVIVEVTAITFVYRDTGNWTDTANWLPSYPGTFVTSFDHDIVNYGNLTIDVLLVLEKTVINYGTIINLNNGTFPDYNSPLYQIDNYGTIINQANGYISVNNGLINNSGTLTGGDGYSWGQYEGEINNTGIISPGNPTNPMGFINIIGNLTNSATSTLIFELEESDITFNNPYDYILVNGTLHLDGTLDVNLINGYVPSVGEIYNIIGTTIALTGTFATINLPVLPPNRQWTINQTATYISLEVTATLSTPTNSINSIILSPNPASNLLSIGGLNTNESVEIVNIAGQKILETEIDRDNNTINISQFSNGLYFLKLKDTTIKFIKE